MGIQKPRGTRDLLPDEMELRTWAEARMRDTVSKYGYREIQTPTFENLDLFIKKSGPGIINEVYEFKDKGGRHMALRPEITASVVRMALENMLHVPKPLRFFYMSNCFRYDRPQKGRYREFFQFGIELLGYDNDLVSTEIIDVACSCIDSIGVEYELKVGHIGILRSLLNAWMVSEEIQTEILHFLDKSDGDDLGGLSRWLTSENINLVSRIFHFNGDVGTMKKELQEYSQALESFESLERVCSLLEKMGRSPEMNLAVVRGLDYYTGMVFEMEDPLLGAEKQICGGGSYALGEIIGDQALPGCGFAVGFDRVLLNVEKPPAKDVVNAYIIPLGSEAEPPSLELCHNLREEDINAIFSIEGRSVGKAMKYADSIGADFALILGENELKEGTVAVKDMKTGKQENVPLDDAADHMKNRKNALST